MRSNFDCSGKKLTFGEIKDFIKNLDKKIATAGTTTASVKPSTATDYDSDAALIEDALDNYDSFTNNMVEEFGFSQNSADVIPKIVIS